jgi:GT2 family glycosyltransferase
MKEPRVSIIILNWNGCKDTIECLQSLYAIEYQNYDIFLIDNKSQDE